jgi:hypothetical protein
MANEDLSDLNAAISREQDETLAALGTTYAERGGLPDELLFSHNTIRALIKSAFRAGVFYERARKGTA